MYRGAITPRTLLFSPASATSAVSPAKQYLVHCLLGDYVPVVP